MYSLEPEFVVFICRMLRLLRDSAGPRTKLLLVEVILPLACSDDTEHEDAGAPLPGAERTLAPAGSPLLANLGKAHASEYLLDISVSSPIMQFRGGQVHTYLLVGAHDRAFIIADDGRAQREGADAAGAVDSGAIRGVEGVESHPRSGLSLGLYDRGARLIMVVLRRQEVHMGEFNFADVCPGVQVGPEVCLH